MCGSMYDTVQAGLINGNVESLQQIYEGLLNRVCATWKCLLAELLSTINSAEFTLSRNFLVEHFVPNYTVDGRKSFSL